MKVTTIEDAIETIKTLSMFKEDLPDGQWEGIKDLFDDFGCVTEEGKRSYKMIRELSEDEQEGFIESLQENLDWWI